MKLTIEVSPGELIDKFTILRIKSARLTSESQLSNVRKEMATIADAVAAAERASVEVAPLSRELETINGELWDIEDDIRACERAKDFGETFIALARSVYVTNDRRAAVKRQINEILSSEIIEEKSYAAY